MALKAKIHNFAVFNKILAVRLEALPYIKR